MLERVWMDSKQVVIVSVTCDNLLFGCMSARCEFSGRDMVMIVYDSPRRLFSTVTPQRGDMYLCYVEHASVVVPMFIMNIGNWLLRRTVLPYDVTREYFPPFKRVNFASRMQYILPCA